MQYCVCACCLLRHRGVRDPRAYGEASTTAPASPSAAEPPCTVCLGVLQHAALRSVASQTTVALSSVTHDGRYKVTVALPASASLVRDRAYAAHLAMQRDATERRAPVADVVSLREAFKWAACARIEEGTPGVAYHADAEVFCDVVFAHDETEAESALLAAPARQPRAHEGYGKNGSKGRKRGRQEGHSDNFSVAPSHSVAQHAVDSLTNEQLRAALGPGFFPPRPVAEPVEVTSSVTVASFVIAGTYNKLSRRVSQTPWFIDFQQGDEIDDEDVREKRTEISVQDVAVAGVKQMFAPGKVTFTAGGREGALFLACSPNV
jgi:hypothetical protein